MSLHTLSPMPSLWLEYVLVHGSDTRLSRENMLGRQAFSSRVESQIGWVSLVSPYHGQSNAFHRGANGSSSTDISHGIGEDNLFWAQYSILRRTRP